MAQDIREMLAEPPAPAPRLPKGHEARFGAKLNEAFKNQTAPVQKNVPWARVAAVALLLLLAGFIGYQNLLKPIPPGAIVGTPTVGPNMAKQITLGDLSPDLKKIENFYRAGINVQLASLQITKDNKTVIDGYMLRLGELDKEYNLLNKELNEVGPNEATITALIDTLKMKLELLFKLKNKLKELKNETFNSIQS